MIAPERWAMTPSALLPVSARGTCVATACVELPPVRARTHSTVAAHHHPSNPPGRTPQWLHPSSMWAPEWRMLNTMNPFVIWKDTVDRWHVIMT